MASPYLYNVGASSGADMLTRSPVYYSGQTYYVSSLIGNSGYTGLDRTKPFDTVANAFAAASAGDQIVCLASHTETIASALTVNKGVKFRGEGSGSARPSFTCNAAIAMFDVTVDGVWFENLQFPASTTAANTARIRFAAGGSLVKGCHFYCGQYDTAGVSYVTGAAKARIVSTTFASSTSSLTTQPTSGVVVTNAMSDLLLETVVFDGGTYGWSGYAFNGSAAVTRLSGVDLQLLNGSDFFVATGSVYEVHVASYSGSSRLVLTA